MMNENYKMEKIDNENDIIKLTNFIYEIDDIFYVPLSTKVDINDYVEKIYNNGIALIIKIEDKIIATLLGYCNDQKNKLAYISTIGVKKEYRGLGIGTELIGYFTNVSIKNGMSFLSLHTHEKNIKAINFYKKNGFEKKIDPDNRDEEVFLVKKIQKV